MNHLVAHDQFFLPLLFMQCIILDRNKNKIFSKEPHNTSSRKHDAQQHLLNKEHSEKLSNATRWWKTLMTATFKCYFKKVFGNRNMNYSGITSTIYARPVHRNP